MKLQKLIICIVFLIGGLVDFKAQSENLLIESEIGHFFEFGEGRINLNENYFEIIDSRGEISKINAVGKKVAKFSENLEYALLLNYNFATEFETGRVDFYLINTTLKVLREEKDIIYHDIPHKLYAVSNSGTVVSLNPFKIDVAVYRAKEETAMVKLSDSYTWDNETQFFIKSDSKSGVDGGDDYFYFAVNNTNPGTIKETGGKVDLYKLNLNDLKLSYSSIPISVVTCFEAFDNIICFAGISETNGEKINKTLFLNSKMEIIKEISIENAKKAIKYHDAYILIGADNYYILNNEFELLNKYNYPTNSSCLDLLIIDGKVYSLISKDENLFFNLFLSEKKVFDFNSLCAILNFGSFESLIKLKCFYIYDSKRTYKIRTN